MRSLCVSPTSMCVASAACGFDVWCDKKKLVRENNEDVGALGKMNFGPSASKAVQ